ncbi:hypothetical protein ADUPG1_003433, partial [Aduncisulcus paluster]
MDEPEVLFYVDPPYVRSTRDLAEILRQVRGYVVISGYPSGLYEKIFQGWPQFSRKAYADKSAERTEVNLDPQTEKHLHNQLIKLGDMLGDGDCDPWVEKEYVRVLKALGIGPKPKKRNSAQINAMMV